MSPFKRRGQISADETFPPDHAADVDKMETSDPSYSQVARMLGCLDSSTCFFMEALVAQVTCPSNPPVREG
ncbi:hypothetical protein BaRGS_00009328 [Batillaria attramentaria]|uniref:Uncharacterized protein n=1 Tax=Batillaria attramentaria TaxID=370345 RepID=A0ABD0LJR6_9CAEN